MAATYVGDPENVPEGRRIWARGFGRAQRTPIPAVTVVEFRLMVQEESQLSCFVATQFFSIKSDDPTPERPLTRLASAISLLLKFPE